MASAIGTALISTILPHMAAKARDIIKDKGKAIFRSIADKAIFRSMADKAMDNIEGDISRLQKTLYTIKGIVQVAEDKQIDDDFIRNWLRDLVDIGYEARDVLDDFIAFSSCIITAYEEASNPVNFISSFMLSYVGGSSSDASNILLAILSRLEEDIRSVRERFDDNNKEGETIKEEAKELKDLKSVRVNSRSEVGAYINQQKHNLFLGRDKVKEEIMEKILRPSHDVVDVVAIWGMGGIGKTTLALSIYNDGSVEEYYTTENRSWLSVGETNFIAEKVIREILNDKETIGIENLQTKLKEKFRGKRFLIVLDDVWDVDGSQWDNLFNPLTNVGNGGLIIITTRKREVCVATNTQTTYDLMPLSNEDSWSLFESCAYKDGKSDSTSELKRIGEEIVKKLKGHPLALKVVGGSLLDKDSSTWTNFLESNDWMLIDDDDDDTDNDIDIMSVLRWSYNHLQPHLKACFTYCALFPKDHVLDKKVLVEMWMAHDLLIQKEKQKRRPEDVLANYFKQLVNASLLQCVDGKHVMHHLIHDLAVLVSNGEFSSAVGSLSTDQMKKVRHITITNDDAYSKNLSLCKSKRILTVYTPYKQNLERFFKIYTILHMGMLPEISMLEKDILNLEVFKQSKSLRVLVLCNQGIEEIPECICELKHLRYLDVSATGVNRLPDSLCQLHNLQMLAAPLDAVLPLDIVNIRTLRYVRAKLPTCRGVAKLTSLQELSSIHVCRGDNIRELRGMKQVRGKLRIEGLENVTSSEDAAGALMEKQTHIVQLELKFNQHSAEPTTIYKAVLDALGCPLNLECLMIFDYPGVQSPSFNSPKFDKLQTLELSNCPKLESLPPLGELTSLKRLSLKKVGVKRLGDEFYGKLTDGKVFFPSLESLGFYDMQEWKEWGDIIIKNSSVSYFPRLTRLEISGCPKLVSVLPDVKNPIMNAANFMTALSSLDISNCERLRSLVISECPKLVSILPVVKNPIMNVANFMTFLSNLVLSDCPKLESLPPLGELTSLKYLSLRNVGVKRLGNEFYGKFTDGKVFFPSLESLSFISMTEWEGWDDIIIKNSSVSFFPRLTELEIRGCHKLVSVLPVVKNPIMNDFMTSLSSLDISNCEPLRSLVISECPKVVLVLPVVKNPIMNAGNFMTSLSNLELSDCPMLESLPPLLTSLEDLFLMKSHEVKGLGD